MLEIALSQVAKPNWKKIAKEYKSQLITTVLAVLLSLVIAIIYHDGTIRFTFIIPIFVGLLFYLILTSKEENSKS